MVIKSFVAVRLMLVVLALLLAMGAGLCLRLWEATREVWLDFAVQSMGKPHWREYLETALSSQRFALLRAGVMGLSVVLLLAAGGCIIFLKPLSRSIAKVLNAMGRVWRQYLCRLPNLSKPQRVLFFVLLGGYALQIIYHAATVPITYDEAWTYLYFTQRGPFFSALVYPTPNNHLLLSVLSACLDYSPLPARWCLRLPVLAAGLLTFYSFLRLSLRLFNPSAALAACCIFVSLSPTFIYGFTARGYGFTLLAATVCLWMTLHFAEGRFNRRYRFAYLLFGFIGFYAVPTYLFAYVGLSLIFLFPVLLKREWTKLRQWLGLQSVLAFMVLLFYSPVLVSSSISGSISDKYALLLRGEAFGRISGEAEKIFAWMAWDNSAAACLLFIGAGVAVMLHLYLSPPLSRLRNALFFFQLVLPSIALLLLLRATPERTWTFLTLYMALLWGSLLGLLPAKRWWSPLFIPFFALFFVAAAWANHRHHFINWSVSLDKRSHQAAKLLQAEGVKRFYTNNFYLKTMLEYEYATRRLPVNGFTTELNSKDYAPENVGFDAVLWDSGMPLPKRFQQYTVLEFNEIMGIYLPPKPLQ